MNIRPSAAIRQNYNEIADLCKKTAEPVFLTKNGYGDLVVMSIETYETMFETAKTDTAITDAEAEYARDGQLHDAKDVFRELRRKHFG